MSFLKSILLVFFLIPFALKAQSPYEINWKKEPYFLGLGAITLSTGLYISTKIDPLTPEEIWALNRADVNSFDRDATFNYSINASLGSDVIFLSSYGLPALFLVHADSRSNFGKIMLLYGESVLLIKGLTNITKRTVKRPRPFTYNEQVDILKKEKKQAQYSFFSGHTSITASNYFFAAKVFSDYYPDSKFKPYVWSIAIIAPAATGYLRVKGGKHFYSDVMAGYAVGAAVGFFVPHLHKIQKGKSLTVLPAPNGLMVNWRFSK